MIIHSLATEGQLVLLILSRTYVPLCFHQQKCLSEVRGPMVDLGVSEYGILSAIATLSDTQNDLDLNHQQPSGVPDPCYSADDIRLFRQIALDLRKFTTAIRLMVFFNFVEQGDSL